MAWREKIFSNIFFRNVLGTFGGRTNLRGGSGEIQPYFQYKIGPYQNDFFLYFPKQLYPLRYKNEIFNKLEEYSGHDVVQFLEFHYKAFPDPTDFLEFLSSEVSERLNKAPRKTSLKSVKEWITQKKSGLRANHALSTSDLESKNVAAVAAELRVEIQENLNNSFREFNERVETSLTHILLKSEQSLRSLTSAFATGNIELNNRLHEDRLIQLLILIQQIKAPGRPEQLFKKINATDIAAILHLHFQPFHDSKLNTVQRKVSEQTEQLRPSQAKTKRLVEALEAFFFS